MILTGKAKEDFLKWVTLNRNILADYHESHVLSDIIEWFDSVGIIINILNQGLQNWFYYEIKTLEIIKGFNLFRTRQETTTEAIIKANEIYNKNQVK